MTVAELMEKLAICPGDAVVWVAQNDETLEELNRVDLCMWQDGVKATLT